MFPRSLRLGRQGFDQSRRLSRATAPHFSLAYGTLTDAAGIGVIVPKKAVKGAVARHRLKRRLREALRDLATIPGFPPTIVVAAKSGADSLTSVELHSELSGAFKAILPEHSFPAS